MSGEPAIGAFPGDLLLCRGKPAAAAFFNPVEHFNVGFDVEQRRAVQHVDPTHLQGGAVDLKQFDEGQPDGIRPQGERVAKTPRSRVSRKGTTLRRMGAAR